MDEDDVVGATAAVFGVAEAFIIPRGVGIVEVADAAAGKGVTEDDLKEARGEGGGRCGDCDCKW